MSARVARHPYTAGTVVRLRCDGCGVEGHLIAGTTVAMARTVMRKRGWTSVDTPARPRDLCMECSRS